MNRSLRLLSLNLLAASTLAQAQNLVYRTVLNKDTTITTVSLRKEAPGLSYRSEQGSGTAKITEEAKLSAEGLVKSWSYANQAENYFVQGRRENATIALTSRRGGKEVKKTLKLQHSWRQVFPHDLTAFVRGADDTILFESVALYGPGALKVGGIQAMKIGDESVRVNGASCACLHVRVALAGFFARFWHADYWFRKSDGRFVKGVWVDKPGAGPSTTELISE